MNKIKKILLLSLSILVISSCTELTPEQAFIHDFPNKIQSSVPIAQLLKSPESLEFLKVDRNIYNGIKASFEKNNISKLLKVYFTLPDGYKLDRIWFIYSIDDISIPYFERKDFFDLYIQKKNISSTEIDIFPKPKIEQESPQNGEYYEFYNISSFIKNVVIRIKKDSQTYYIKSQNVIFIPTNFVN